MSEYPDLKGVQIKVDPLLRVLCDLDHASVSSSPIPAELSLDMSLEKKLIEEYSKKVSPRLQKTPPSSTATANTPGNNSTVNSLADKLQQLKTSPPASVLSGSLPQSKSDDLGAEVSNLYMPDDSPQRRQAFARAYSLVKGVSTLATVTDIDILRAFMLFESNADYEKDILAYLQAFVALKELGFSEEAISTALLLHKNNQEEALEHLMKHS